jgi:hypothetical protein
VRVGTNHNLSGELEQVYVKGMKRRAWRLLTGPGVALIAAIVLLSFTASAQDISTATTLRVQTRSLNGQMQATATVTVTGADGLPAKGVVSIEDGDRLLAQAALDTTGQANPAFTLPGGDHALRAVYTGDATHQSSTSPATEVQADAGATPSFQVSITPIPPTTLPMNLTPGQSGSLIVTVTPEDNAALTSPMFVTLSCSNLPTLVNCSFAPENVEISSTTPASCPAGSPAAACPPTSQMVLTTDGPGTSGGPQPPASRPATPLGLSLLLPGALGLGGLAWGVRRRRWLQRLALMALVGLVVTLGATACNPLYRYYNHGPEPQVPTPAGTYTIAVTAQSSNGVTAITNSTSFVLTVK